MLQGCKAGVPPPAPPLLPLRSSRQRQRHGGRVPGCVTAGCSAKPFSCMSEQPEVQKPPAADCPPVARAAVDASGALRQTWLSSSHHHKISCESTVSAVKGRWQCKQAGSAWASQDGRRCRCRPWQRHLHRRPPPQPLHRPLLHVLGRVMLHATSHARHRGVNRCRIHPPEG